jgi:hypothetical protein
VITEDPPAQRVITEDTPAQRVITEDTPAQRVRIFRRKEIRAGDRRLIRDR